MTPASPSPAPDLNTQAALAKAQEQINSLQQQLTNLQTQAQSTPTGASEAQLIQSWQADQKVAQIACENKLLGSWQLGSAVLISADGKILTNQHVVEPTTGPLPDYCIVMFNKDFDPSTQKYQREYRATITGFFQDRDAALMKIYDVIYLDTNGAVRSTPVSETFKYFQPSSVRPQIGDTVYILGYPESANFNYSLTKGIISNFTSDGLYFGTDAQIDRGNSGGAALSSGGQLIGIPTWKFVSSGDYRGYILDIQSLKLN
jgi:S1-C subfamily serine protease